VNAVLGIKRIKSMELRVCHDPFYWVKSSRISRRAAEVGLVSASVAASSINK